jgi:uncharacterized membrane protein
MIMTMMAPESFEKKVGWNVPCIVLIFIFVGPSLQQMTPGPSISTAIRPSSTMAQTIQISQSTTSLIANNPLKRKLDDDDYDT